MSRVEINEVVQRPSASGALMVVAGALVHVYERGTTTPAQWFSAASGGTGSTTAIVTDDEGRIEAWVESGSYDLAVTYGDVTYTQPYDALSYVDSGAVPDASGSTKGKLRLAGDLGGTAASPTVPGLADKADLVDGVVPANQLPPGSASAVRTVTAATTVSDDDDIILADATGLEPPTNLTAAALGSGGTFTANTWYWVVTALRGSEESAISNEDGEYIAANGRATLTWTKVTGATGYKIYRSYISHSATYNGTALVATVGDVATYTDTGSAVVAGQAPTNNGAGFSVTLPSAVGFERKVTIRAIGRNPNAVTVVPSGSERIDTRLGIQLGNAYRYSAITVASDGTNWQIVSATTTPTRRVQSVNAFHTDCLDGVITPLAVLPMPRIERGDVVTFFYTAELKPGAGVTGLTPSVNVTDSSGTYISNISFHNDDGFAVGERKTFTSSWVYDSVYDYDKIVGQDGIYVSFQLYSAGGTTDVFSSQLIADVGPSANTYYPHI